MRLPSKSEPDDLREPGLRGRRKFGRSRPAQEAFRSPPAPLRPCLLVVLFFQFKARRYIPGIYWLAVVLISVVGTLISDNLVDNLGVALETTTIAFAIALTLTFTAWYLSERTLSIHSIVTGKREAFYWLTVLFTFALGTSGGDLVSERAGLGYFTAILIFGGAIALVAALHYGGKLGPVLAFWTAYILTRPLGASIGDWMSQKHWRGGLGLGTTVTSFTFLGTILALVIFLSVTKVDETQPELIRAEVEPA